MNIASHQNFVGLPTDERLPSDETVFPVAWYAIAWSRELKDKPLKRKILGQDIVIYRDGKNHVRALNAYCSHRGADLSLGHCTERGLTCVYHGWTFSADGGCISIPAHPDRPIPEFARVTAYSVQERAGLIWLYPTPFKSDQEIPELILFPELEDPHFTLAAYDQHWQAHLTRVVESVLDVAHLAFVHKQTIGKRVPKEIIHMQFEVPDRDTIIIKNGGGLLYYQFPQQWILRPATTSHSQFINYVTFTPVDRQETIIFGYAGRTFARFIPGLSAIFSRYSLKVLSEDKNIVESQHPRPIPEALRMEAHVPADAPQVRFRQRWFEFLSNDRETKIMLK
ncbi:aromatic ring-hydroxylating oxygenase subunit alpha [Sulfoacidibacillus ferrooxidans]|uniref:Methylxanthine N1-demethylase NdmA n=1 Tax=Sulfoacidibacillus ferrooxidans TaxID=2005001 RepID=A0A9X2ADD3_9BACL|nr:aromatic ring-hydroxylating dioxygenase subunit alpha [Sulfoacidibacillus ferrooxidans]MCI0182232.1 Methylxanthine N1-demethylase NdmA [Sulfoacidibacillus ferrooxidans]